MHFLLLTLRTESNYYLDRLISDLANGKETIIKRNKGQSNLAKAASPAHWRFGLQSSNLAPHVGGTGRLNGSEIAPIDSDGGRLSIVTMSLAVTVWPQIAMQIFGTPFPVLGENLFTIGLYILRTYYYNNISWKVAKIGVRQSTLATYV